jgi:hypothetical protein
MSIKDFNEYQKNIKKEYRVRDRIVRRITNAKKNLPIFKLNSNNEGANQHINDLSKVITIMSGYYNPPLANLCWWASHDAELHDHTKDREVNLKILKALSDLASALCPTKSGEETCFDWRAIAKRPNGN